MRASKDTRRLSRRTFLRNSLIGASAASLVGLDLPEALLANAKAQANTLAKKAPFNESEESFLEELEKANFQYFWAQAHPDTGLVQDRCHANNPVTNELSSIAATGFGLTALCIGEKRGFVSKPEAESRVLNTLRFLWKKQPHHRGFFYHWADINSGDRIFESEVSSVDTAILLCGVLTCRQYFEHSEISELALEIFNRVDWGWLSEDTLILPHGWTPENGFLQYRWGDYSELMMMYLLGLGSSTHPLPPEAWDAWKRTIFEYNGVKYIGSFAPLFIHQYSQAWFDFRNKRDQYADYFLNSTAAVKVHKQFCLDLKGQFPDYSEDLWGITASDSANGYVAWGGPPATGPIDGTVVPCAAGGSLAFLPADSLRVLRNIRNSYSATWSRYGFIDAFNPLTGWYDIDIVGIDTGITMIMAENARTSLVWETFMKNPEAQRGMERAGFKSYEPSSKDNGQIFSPALRAAAL